MCSNVVCILTSRDRIEEKLRLSKWQAADFRQLAAG